jgi:hypothetical protein
VNVSQKPLMKIRLSILSLAALCSLVTSHLCAQSTAFTYQGRLNQNGVPATGLFDVQFVLFGEATGGSPVSNSITNSAVRITNGLFTVLLDFGSDTFNGADRWLDVAVRVAGSGTFTPLAPRQPITPTPYAVTALIARQVPGVSGYALHAADGSPQNAVFVDNTGNVGVGTTTPLSTLHLSGTNSRLRMESTQNDNWTTTEYRTDGREWHTGVGGSQVPNSLQSKYYVYDYTAAQPRLVVDTAGNVGVGTTAPAARLHVQGEVRLGPGGRLLAAGGDEGLRILRGKINEEGTVASGSGFICTRLATGNYRIDFTRSFSGSPVTIANASVAGIDATPLVAMIANPTPDKVEILLRRGSDGALVSRQFHFMIIGEPE